MSRYISTLIIVLAALLGAPSQMLAADHGDATKIDPKEIIFEHLGDGYGWEVPFDHHKRMPLPVIVFGSDGLHI